MNGRSHMQGGLKIGFFRKKWMQTGSSDRYSHWPLLSLYETEWREHGYVTCQCCHCAKDNWFGEVGWFYFFSLLSLYADVCVMPGAWEMSPSDRVSTSWSPSLPAHQGLTHPPSPTLLKHPSPTPPPPGFPRHPEGGGGLYYQPFILHSSFALSRKCSHPSRVFNSLKCLPHHLSALLCWGGTVPHASITITYL